MKQCNHCKEFKQESEFSWRYKSLGVRQRTCKTCIAKYNADGYASRSKDHIEKVKNQRAARRDDARRYIWKYLESHPCVDCGESDPRFLEFDHVRGTKKTTVSEMVGQGYSIKSIQKEIEKCEVRCGHCHKKKTFEERGWFSG